MQSLRRKPAQTQRAAVSEPSREEIEPRYPTNSIDPDTGRPVSWDPELDRQNQENTQAAQEQQYRDYQASHGEDSQ